jgi:hypothetical protein
MAYNEIPEVGQELMAGSLPVVLASDHSDIKITLDSEAILLAAGTNNIGDVDVLSLPALPTGTNNIGDVDVLTLPSLPVGANTIGNIHLELTDASGNGIITDVGVFDALNTIIYDSNGTVLELAVDGAAAQTMGIHALGTDGTNAQILSTNASGHLNIADGGNTITVDGTVTVTDGLNVEGDVAHDTADSGNPVKVGGVAVSGSATPTSVASGDRVRFIANMVYLMQ